jgi:hypothetical protein
MVPVLFTRKNSIYKTLGADCYDADRDALSWPGGTHFIAHPPCRAWGRYRHRSKHTELEKSYALTAMEWVRRYGGILEHPASSTLWRHLQPTDTTTVISQFDFGHRAEKMTRLMHNGIDLPPVPAPRYGPPLRVEVMGKAERERTPRDLANFLMEAIQ